MDESEKMLLENLKNFDFKKLLTKKSYVDIQVQDNSRTAFIIEEKENDKFEVNIEGVRGTLDVPINIINFYSNFSDDNIRQEIIYQDLVNQRPEQIISYIKEKLTIFNVKLKKNNNYNKKGNNTNTTSSNIKMVLPDKNGKSVNITGYKSFQFFGGYILDCLGIINIELINKRISTSHKTLFVLLLDIIIYLGEVVKSNLKKYKTAYYNRKLLIVSQIHGILICFSSLINNMKSYYQYNYSGFIDLEVRLKEIVNIVYDILVTSNEKCYIPLPCLIIFYRFILFNDVHEKIFNYDRKIMFKTLTEHLKNLNENELKYFKRNSDLKEECGSLISDIYEKNMPTLANQAYYYYLLSCLKCKNLEKRMNALNDISDIINESSGSNKINTVFKKFIDENNILEIFFEDSVHDEVIKRANILFRYFAKYDSLDDKIIEKIIERINNDFMKKLLIEIVSELPRQKKDILFKRLSLGIKFDNNNNIEYISKLTEACFNKLNKEETPKTKENNNYYGLIMIFNYIIKDFDDKKKYDENNVDVAIDWFDHTIFQIIRNNTLKVENAFYFVDSLFDNIKSNNKHNSVIQSMKLIEKLLNIFRIAKENTIFLNNLKALDEKYDIITLLVNDLVRYMEILPSEYSNEKIYEGIYPHNINIEQRLKLIFYFFKKSENNYGIIIKGKKHIEKIYQIFKLKQYKEERKKFYEIFTRNMNEIDDLILIEFFRDILQKKEELNLKEINDNESINFMIQIFKKVNENNGNFLYDGRKIRIDNISNIEGFNLLFDLLTQNPDKNVQNKISELLCTLCLSFKDYNNPKIPEYWKTYFKKINLYLDNINKSQDKIAFNGIIKLINKIYSSSVNCYGKIPEKEDYQQTQEPFKIYHFIRVGTKKEYKLKVGENDLIVEMRWKLGYYYDIPVNNVTFIDLNGKRYSINNDFERFITFFSNEKYLQERNFAYIKIDEVPFQLLQMEDNPKSLIDKNENIYKILIDNLKVDLSNDKDNNEIEIKFIIWNIISKLPKNYYFVNKLKKFGDKENITESDLMQIFNIKDIYLLTYSLQCFYYFLFDINNEKDKQINQIIPDKKEYLNNFIGIYHVDKLILDNLLKIQIDQGNWKPIQIECITIIIDILNGIEKYKQKQKEKEKEKEKSFENLYDNTELFNNTLKQLTEIISSLLELNYNNYKNYLIQGNDDAKEHNASKNEDYKVKINENIANLIENIFSFIEEITKNKISYMDYIFNNSDLFTKVFVYDYIKCENDESRKKIDEYLMKNYAKNNDYINKYFEVVLTVDIFNYLIKNDKAGKYFHVISSIMKKYYENKNNNNANTNTNGNDKSTPEDAKDTEKESNHIKQSKQIIDIILDYIQNDCDKNEENNNENMEENERKVLMKNRENFKEGIILFLTNILNINQKELVKYIVTKVDICDLFINKCSLRKCIEKPLETKEPFCHTNQSQSAVYKLIIILLKNIENDDLYLKVVKMLDKYHLFGFWKTYNFKNWELESREMQKGKYVGLKNMTATCYLNSIIQQLYMIPIFRETILKINNTSKNNVLYELQLLFSALKIYEFAYYDPRSFVVINKLNFYEQMDADEFYGTLIDKIENDIKKIYFKPTPEEKPEKTDTKNNPKNENYKYKDIFKFFFGIKVVDELKFVDCGHKRYNEFFYNSIQLEIKEFNNINESLKNYFKTEIMDGDNKINCEQCKIKRTCHKHLIFKSLPNILVIALKRFEFDYNTMLKYKLNKYFEFPFELDMKDYLIENHTETNTEYELTGITIHFGVADFGHYYDLIKGPDNKWYKFNDISVSEFKEEEIPKEAFGEKDIFDEDSYKEKENGKNNAYILIYKKKNFETVAIDKNTESDLALPPFNKYSNINDDIKNEINLKLYKSWTIKNITSSVYQNFVLSLLKLDISKILDQNDEKSNARLLKILKSEGYTIGSKKTPTKDGDTNEGNNEIFQFCLRYYFSVFLRISRRSQDKNINQLFQDVIKCYLESDLNKAKYLLEEFSNTEVIKEYLIFCPNIDSVKDCLELIIYTFNIVYKKNPPNDSFIYEFINTLINYIEENIRQFSIESITYLFLQLILGKGQNKLISYLKKKSFEKWVDSFYRNHGYEIAKKIVNKSQFPPLKAQHSILIDKTFKDAQNEIGANKEHDLYDQQFLSKLHDTGNVRNFIEQLGHYFD